MQEATYSQLIPLSELAPGQAAKIRADAIAATVALASKATNLPPDRLVVRDIRAASDLDYTYEDWGEKTGATADAYETMTTGTMTDARWVAIFGVKLNPDAVSCSALKFNIGGGDRAIWQLQSLNEEDGMVGFSPAAVIIPQNGPYTISRYVLYANSGSSIVLKGIVVEPRGKVVTP